MCTSWPHAWATPATLLCQGSVGRVVDGQRVEVGAQGDQRTGVTEVGHDPGVAGCGRAASPTWSRWWQTRSVVRRSCHDSSGWACRSRRRSTRSSACLSTTVSTSASAASLDEVFQITDEQATPKLVRDFMRRRFLKLKRSDRLLFYFGGHGTDLNGVTGYILFSRALRSEVDDDNSIPTNDIREWSAILPAKNVLFLLDSCSAGYGFTAMGGASTDADLLNALGDARSRWIVTGRNRQARDVQTLTSPRQLPSSVMPS